jgi:hypothetical protein
MMSELIRIGDEIGAGLRDFLGSLGFSQSIRGVLLDVDDHWESAEITRNFRYLFPYGYLFHELHEANYRRLYFQGMSFTEPYLPDIGFRPPWWDDHCRAMGYPIGAGPIIIRVIFKEDSQIETTDFPGNYQDYPIIYEFRPPNRALTSYGLMERLGGAIDWIAGRGEGKAPSVGRANPNTAGTLGGILGGSDPRKKYIVTCAHVLGPSGTEVYQPGPFEGKQSLQIGTVKHWIIPDRASTDDPCSEQAAPNAVRLDLAVAELTIGVDELREMGVVTTVNTVRSIVAMRKNDRVIFTGKRTGRIESKIGALTLWDQIEFPDGTRCFGRIFEIKSPTREYIRADLAHPGDSGSWIVFQMDDRVAWYGMVISCDGGQAYACFADYILEECKGCGVFPGGLKLGA